MHVIREKSSGRVLHIDYGSSEGPLPADAVFEGFAPEAMELGWTPGAHIPAYFEIDARGHVIELALPDAVARGLHQLGATQKLVEGAIVAKSDDELIADGLISLEQLKTQAIDAYSELAFRLRAQLIPEYKLQNAALGVYGEKTLAQFKATIEAFRTEFYRLKAEIGRASSGAALRAIEPKFPTAVSQA